MERILREKLTVSHQINPSLLTSKLIVVFLRDEARQCHTEVPI